MPLGVREIDLRLLDEVVHLMLVTVEEGRDTHDHLIDEDAERPPVHRVVVTVADQHLRGKILCRAAERVGQLTTVLNKLSETEIRHQQIPVITD